MRSVVVATAVYPPEPVVSAQMGRDLAAHLAGIGAQVTVLCPFPTRPMGAKYSNYRANGSAIVVQEDGLTVVRLPSFTSPDSRLFSRMRESLSFGRHACRYLDQQLGHVEAVYANTWPLFSQALIARHCARRGIPLVLHIQDIYPESLLGKLPGFCRGMAAAPLIALDRRTAARAARVVVISENMRRIYVENRGLAPEKVITSMNWVDEGRFARLPAKVEACEHYRVPQDRFTFLYLGNIGPVAGVEALIEALDAAHLKQAQLVIAGDGSAKAMCVERVKSLGAGNVRFISDPEADNVPLIQSLADVCLLPLRQGAGLSSIPSKLMAYLLSAKPVLATVDAESDTARCIREAQCGWVGEPENVDWLAGKMAEVAAMPNDVLIKMGANGREYGLQHFSKTLGVQKLAKIILDAAGRA